MTICIIGAAGFIGTNLTRRLATDSKNTITLVGENQAHFQNIISMGYENVNIKISPFSKDADFETLLSENEVLFHLASTTNPSSSNRKIGYEVESNVVTTTLLLDACVKCGVKRVVFLSSGGTVYGREAKCPIPETAPTDPISAYGLQKLTIEKLLHLYGYIHALDYRIIRLSNPYGPYQRPNGKLGALTTFTYKALQHMPIEVYGDGSVVRDYVYIDDAINAIINIAFDDGGEKIYNFGSGKGTSLNELLQLISSTLQTELQLCYLPSRQVDVPRNYLDISRYEKRFGKPALISLETGIAKTADFLSTNKSL